MHVLLRKGTSLAVSINPRRQRLNFCRATGGTRVKAAMNLEQAKAAQQQIRSILDETHANPIFVRLAWHDSGSYSAVRVCVGRRPR